MNPEEGPCPETESGLKELALEALREMLPRHSLGSIRCAVRRSYSAAGIKTGLPSASALIK